MDVCPAAREVRPRSALPAFCLSITHTHTHIRVTPAHPFTQHPTHPPAPQPLLPRIKANSSSFMFGPPPPTSLAPDAPPSPKHPPIGSQPLSSTSPGHYAGPYFKLIPPVLSINTFISPSSRLPFAPLLSPLQQILDQAHYLRCPLYTLRDPSRSGLARGICLSGTGRETLGQIWFLDAHGWPGRGNEAEMLMDCFMN